METTERIFDKYTKDAVRTSVGIVVMLVSFFLFVGSNVPTFVSSYSVFERVFAILVFAFVFGRCANTIGRFTKKRLARLVLGEELKDDEDSEIIKDAFKSTHTLHDDGAILRSEVYRHIGEKRFVRFRYEDLDNSSEFWDTVVGAQVIALIYLLLAGILLGLSGLLIFVVLVVFGSSIAASIEAQVDRHRFYKDCVTAFQRSH